MILTMMALMIFFMWNRSRDSSWEWPFYIVPAALFVMCLWQLAIGDMLSVQSAAACALVVLPFMTYSKTEYYVAHLAVCLFITLLF